MLDENGKTVEEALPSMPVVALGLSDVPVAGDVFEVVDDDPTARAIAEERIMEQEAEELQVPYALTLDDLSARVREGEVKELNLIVKADVQGSIEPVVASLEELGGEDLKVEVIHAGTGNIIESDINLAIASNAIVVGFQVIVDPAARRLAESEGVDIRIYEVIYKLVDDVDRALKGLLEPTYVERTIGRATIRATFEISDVGKIAGCYVAEGEARRNARARVFREEEQLYDGHVASLKRFEKDVREVRTGFECGVGLEGFHDLEVGDVIEFYVEEREE
jgi:translation initiation factor IF-2